MEYRTLFDNTDSISIITYASAVEFIFTMCTYHSLFFAINFPAKRTSPDTCATGTLLQRRRVWYVKRAGECQFWDKTCVHQHGGGSSSTKGGKGGNVAGRKVLSVLPVELPMCSRQASFVWSSRRRERLSVLVFFKSLTLEKSNWTRHFSPRYLTPPLACKLYTRLSLVSRDRLFCCDKKLRVTRWCKIWRLSFRSCCRYVKPNAVHKKG